MKKIRFKIIFTIVIIVIVLMYIIQSLIVSYCIADLDNDGVKEIIILKGSINSEYANTLIIYTRNKAANIQKYDFESLKPWKVQAADVDGDKACEISVSVYTKARLHPVLAKRPFLYNWHGNGISPKWLGSRLARPFEDYILADIDNDNMHELISIEYISDKKMLVNSYKWKGFGFESLAESKIFSNIKKINKYKKRNNSSHEIKIYAKLEQKYKWYVIKYKENKLIKIPD